MHLQGAFPHAPSDVAVQPERRPLRSVTDVVVGVDQAVAHANDTRRIGRKAGRIMRTQLVQGLANDRQLALNGTFGFPIGQVRILHLHLGRKRADGLHCFQYAKPILAARSVIDLHLGPLNLLA